MATPSSATSSILAHALFQGMQKGVIPSTPIESLVEYHIGGGWGKDIPDAEHTEQVAVIRGTDIPSARLGDLSRVPLRYEKPRVVSSRALEVGDLVFEVSGGSKMQGVGRCLAVTDRLLGEYEHPVICASFCKLIRPYSASDGCFLGLLIQMARECGYLDRFESRSASNIINFKFKQFLLEFPVPVLATEERDLFDRSAAAICAEIECRGRELYALEQMALGLLPKLTNRKDAP